jgi:hypothetical protein
MGASALHRWRQENPERFREIAARGLVRANQVRQERALVAREVRANERRFRALFRGYPHNSDRKAQGEWYEHTFLKCAADTTLPACVLRGFQSAYRVWRDQRPTKEEEARDTEFSVRLRYEEYRRAELEKRYQDAQREIRELRCRVEEFTRRGQELDRREAALEQRAKQMDSAQTPANANGRASVETHMRLCVGLEILGPVGTRVRMAVAWNRDAFEGSSKENFVPAYREVDAGFEYFALPWPPPPASST